MVPHPPPAPAFPPLEGLLLICVASDRPCQPCVSKALIHSPSEPSCTAGMAGCCHTAASLFHRQAAQFQPLEGPCEFSSLKQADCCFSIFHNCESETRAFPTQPGQTPIGAYILPPRPNLAPHEPPLCSPSGTQTQPVAVYDGK